MPVALDLQPFLATSVRLAVLGLLLETCAAQQVGPCGPNDNWAGDGVCDVPLQCRQGTDVDDCCINTIDGFLGPHVGQGITSFNDLGHSTNSNPADCAARCAADVSCLSFDMGVSGSSVGVCYLSTANRVIAARSYTAWPDYHY